MKNTMNICLKKGAAIFMAAMMSVSLLPMAAFAEGEPLLDDPTMGGMTMPGGDILDYNQGNWSVRFDWNLDGTGVMSVSISNMGASTGTGMEPEQVGDVTVEQIDYQAPGCETAGYAIYRAHVTYRIDGVEQEFTSEGQGVDSQDSRVDIPALNHSWVLDAEASTPATCGESGQNVYVCGNCSDRRTETVDPTGNHLFSSASRIAREQAPTAEADGWVVYYCDICGQETAPQVVTYVEAHEHVLDKTDARYIDVVEPTCGEDGVKTFHCTVEGCHYTETETIPATGEHTWGEGVDTSADCFQDGYTTYTCTVCHGATNVVTHEGTQLDHDYSDVVEVVQPTCEHSGYTIYACTHCGSRETRDYTLSVPHNWDNGVVTVQPTCQAPGQMTYTCTMCHEAFYTEEINALNHIWGDWEEITPATYTSAGQEQRVCTLCEETETREIPKLSLDGHTHVWSDGTVTVEATCEEDGVMTYTCTQCNETRTEPIPKLGHDWKLSGWQWEADHSAAVATFVCNRDNGHTMTVSTNDAGGRVSVSTREATTAVKGETVYTALVMLGYTSFTTRDVVEIAVLQPAPAAPTGGGSVGGGGAAAPSSNAGTTPAAPATQPATTEINDEEVPLADLPTLFVDVAKDAYYAASVRWAVANNVTTGTSATTFDPDALCTRAQFVTFLYRAAGSPDVSGIENPFTDVAQGKYYTEAVLWAVSQGITSGVKEGIFAPNETLTRAEAVTFLNRYAGGGSGDASVFVDVPNGKYYTGAVGWAVENGITTGASADKFKPNAQVNRAQVVTFLDRQFAEA